MDCLSSYRQRTYIERVMSCSALKLCMQSIVIFSGINCSSANSITIAQSMITHSLLILSTFLSPFSKNPSCLQTTLASSKLHPSSHTTPHRPQRQTSTRPSLGVIPPERRTLFSTHSPPAQSKIYFFPKCKP